MAKKNKKEWHNWPDRMSDNEIYKRVKNQSTLERGVNKFFGTHFYNPEHGIADKVKVAIGRVDAAKDIEKRIMSGKTPFTKSAAQKFKEKYGK